jgi:hypothetical protein
MERQTIASGSIQLLTVCLVEGPRERSGAAPLSRPFGWGASGAEWLPREYTVNIWVGPVPQNSRDGAAPLPFLLCRFPPVSLRLSPVLALELAVESMVAEGARPPVARLPVSRPAARARLETASAVCLVLAREAQGRR